MTTDAELARLRAHKRTLMRTVAILLPVAGSLVIAVAYLLWQQQPSHAAVSLPQPTGELTDQQVFTPVADPGIDFTFFPGLKEEPTWATEVPLTTNWAGMRDPRQLNEKPADVFRVVLLGDSMVAAQAAPYEDGVAHQLEGLLNKQAVRPEGIQRFEVRPIAVSGWNVFSAVRFATHNLHVLAPDLVVLLLNRNDMDSGSGFVHGHTLVSAYDVQRLRSTSHASLASPSYFLRRNAEAWGLVASDLIPESRRRFEAAGAEIGRLHDLLTSRNGTFFCYLYDDYLAPGLARTLPDNMPRADILLGPAEVTENNLLPKDGHPNRAGHGHLARVLAAHASERGVIEFRTPVTSVPFHTFAQQAPDPATTQQTFAVNLVPTGFAIRDGVIDPIDGARCVVGGCYATGVLSPHAVFAVRRAKATKIRAIVQFPDVPALTGGEVAITIGGATATTVAMTGRQTIEVAIPTDAETNQLVEVRFDASRYYTRPNQGLDNGVWTAAPQAGRLLELRAIGN